ncbi:MAG: PKD domain-containing protein [Bacteroidales bacterium]|nr:PKD domain-containing protein [Bacteroidales bacterium]
MAHVPSYDGRLTLTNLPVGYYKVRVYDAGTSIEGGKVAYYVGTDNKKHYFDIDNSVVDAATNKVTAFYIMMNGANKVYVSNSDVSINMNNGAISSTKYIPDPSQTVQYEQQNIEYGNFREVTYRLDNSQDIELNVDQWTVKHQSCYGDVYDGAISPVVVAMDASNLTYSWSGPAGFTSNEMNISGLKYGTYYLTVTDDRGCSAREGVVVKQATQIQFELQLAGDPCDVENRVIKVVHKDENGNYVPGVTGGSTTDLIKYTFDWSGEVTPTWVEKENGVDVFEARDITAGGVYTVYVRDANMCTVSQSTEELHSAVTVEANVQNVTCYNGYNGRIEPTISGGMGNFEYHWYYSEDGSYTLDDLKADIAADANPANITTGKELKARNNTTQDITTRVASELQAGTYYLIITDWQTADFASATSTTCKHNYYFSWNVTQPTELKAVAHNDNQPIYTTCYGYSDATITVDVTGGKAPYSYEWNIGSTTVTTDEPKLSNLASGTYFVIVTDANGCSAQDYAVVHDAAPLDFYFEADQVDCYGKNGKLEIKWTNTDPSLDPALDPLVSVSWSGKSIQTNKSSSLLKDHPEILSQDALASGVYTVRVTRGNNCAVVNSYEFDYPMLFTDSTVTDNRCSGSQTGMITVEVAGGSGVYGYEWEAYTDASMTERLENSGVNNNNGPYQAGLMAGYYVVRVYDKTRTNATTGYNDANSSYNEHCYITKGFTVKNKTHLTVIATDGIESCAGALDGQIIVSVTGGSGNYTYKWYGDGDGITNDTTQNQHTLGVGHYQVIVTDVNNNCTASRSAQIEGSQTMLEAEVASITNIDCYNESTGEIVIRGNGGTPFTGTDANGQPYSYYKFVWQHQTDPDETGLESTVDNLMAGKYHVTVKDYYGCAVPLDIELTQKEAIAATHTVTDIVKNGDATGTIRITGITGGTYPYHIKWYKGAVADNVSAGDDDATYVDGLSAGLYTYVVTDKNGCSKEFTATVSDDGALMVKFDKRLDVLCYGESTGRIEVSIYNGKKPFSISVNGIVKTDNYDGGIYVMRNLPAGWYTIVVTDSNGASFQQSVEIIQPEHPLTFSVDNYDVQCYNTNSATARVIVSGGTPFIDAATNKPYYHVQRNVQSPENAIEELQNSPGIYYHDFTNLRIGNYRFSVTDANGCYLSEYLTLTEHDEITLTRDTVTHVLCHGEATGAIDVTVKGATNAKYEWYYEDETTPMVDDNNAPLNTNKLINLKAGRYYLVVTDIGQTNNCQSNRFEFVVKEPSEFNVSAVSYDITTCNGDNSGQILLTLNGGVKPYTVTIARGTETLETRTLNVNTTTFDGLIAGTYYINAHDANGCNFSEITKPIYEPAALEVSDVEAYIGCSAADGTLSFTVNGGNVANNATRYTISLIGPNSDATWTATVAGTQNANGSYSVTLDATNAPANAKLSGLPEGDYVLTVKDANSTDLNFCAIKNTFRIQNMHIVLESEDNPTCAGINDGAINISVNGNVNDVTFLWQRKDDTGAWADLAVGKNNQNATALEAGEYKVIVTDPKRDGTNDCSVEREFELTNVNVLTVSASTKAEQCYGANDGAINNVVVTGVVDQSKLKYEWSGSNFASTIEEISGLAPGAYLLTVTDGTTQCKVSKEFTVAAAASPIEMKLTDAAIDCDYSHTITVDVKGGSGGYRYFASGNSSTMSLPKEPTATTGWTETRKLTADKGGVYKFTIYDSNNCMIVDSITLDSRLMVTGDVTNIKCYGGAFGAIDLTVTGGSGSYTYEWSGPGVTNENKNVSNLSSVVAGVYTVTVTDNNDKDGQGDNCSVTKTFTITQPKQLIIEETGGVTDVTCNGSKDGKIAITVSGGQAPYSYLWNNGATTNRLSNLDGGSYSVTVTDYYGCTATHAFEVKEPSAIDFDIERVTDVTCNGDGGELKIVNLKGGYGYEDGTATYDIVWSGENLARLADDKMSAANLTSYNNGLYKITVTDHAAGHNSCSLTKSYAFSTPLTAQLISVKDETCEGQVDGRITIDVKGGSGDYNYEWTTIDGAGLNPTIQNQDGLRAGTYNVKITDNVANAAGENCSVELNGIEVKRQHTIVVNPLITDVKCAGESSGAIKLVLSGGSGNYSLTWTGTCANLVRSQSATIPRFASNVEVVQNNLTKGQYSVTITDEDLGCEVTHTYYVDGAEYELEIASIDVVDVLPCKGDYTGSITVHVEGGIGPYTYSWSGEGVNFPNDSVITDLKAGKYQVNVTDYKGCLVSSGNIEVAEPPIRLAVAVDRVVNVTSQGGQNGEIVVSVTGGVGSYVYDWYKLEDVNGQLEWTNLALDGVSHINKLKAGDYKIVVTDENNCTATKEYIHVGEPNEPLAIRTATTDITPCYNDNNGTIDIDVYGGTLPYTIWCYDASGRLVKESTGTGALNITDLKAGSYTIKVMDANRVRDFVDMNTNSTTKVSEKIVTINQPELLTLNKNWATGKVTNVACYGAETGEFTLTVTGGMKTDDKYYVSITGPNGYSSVISDMSGEQLYSNLKAGVYNITVIDDSDKDGRYNSTTDCWLTDTIEIHQPEAHVELSKVIADETQRYICEGQSRELKLIVTNWDLTKTPLKVVIRKDDDPTQETTYDVDKSPYVFAVTPSETSTYRVVAVYEDDASCGRGTFDGDAETVEVRVRPRAYIHGDYNVCFGSTITASVDITPESAGPWNFVISDGTTNYNQEHITETPFIFSYTPQAPTKIGANQEPITLVVTSLSDANCESVEADLTGKATIVVNDLPTVKMGGSESICEGERAKIYFVVDGGKAPYTITYYYDLNGIQVTQTLLDKVPEQDVIDGETVNVIYSYVSPEVTTVYNIGGLIDANGCAPAVIDGNVTIIVKEQPDIPVAIKGPYVNGVAEDFVCQGAHNVVFTIDAVDNATGYEWTVPDGMTIVAGNGSTSIAVDVSETFEQGMVLVSSRNDCGLSQQRAMLVSANLLPVKPQGIVSIDGQSFCQGQTRIRMYVPSVANASKYEWDLPTGFSIVYGEGTSNILLDVSETVASLDGTIRVRGINNCGEGEWSEPFDIAIHPLPKFTAGKDQQVCSETSQLTAESTVIAGETYSYLWTTVYGGVVADDPTNLTSTVSNLTQGDNELMLTVTTDHGCVLTDNVIIRNNKLSVTARPVETLICDGQTELSATAIPTGCTGLWSVEKGRGEFDDANSPIANVTDLQKGKSTLRWTITQNGCDSYDEFVVENTEPDDPEIVIKRNSSDAGKVVTYEEYKDATYRFVVCPEPGETLASIIIAGKAVDTSIYPDQTATWERISGGSSIKTDVLTQELSDLTIGDNIFKYTVKNGSCSKVLTINIFNAHLKVSAGLDDATCDESYRLEGSQVPAGMYGHWETLSGTYATFADATSNVTMVSNMSRGDNHLRWIINQEGCESFDDVVITNNRVTQATTQATIVTCDGATSFTGNAYNPAYETGKWTIIKGWAKIEDYNDPTTLASNFDRGVNVFRWTITSHEGGCSSSSDLTVRNNAFEVNAGRDTLVCRSQTVIQAITPRPAKDEGGEWRLVPGKGSATIASPTSYVTEVGGLQHGPNYFIWEVQQNNCKMSDTVIVTYNTPILESKDYTNVAYQGTDATSTITLSGGATTTNMQAIGVKDAVGPDFSNENGQGTWSLVSGGGSISDEDIHNPNALVYNLQNGTSVFRWTVEKQGCKIEGDVNVVYGDVTPPNAGYQVINNCSSTYQLSANGPFNGIGQWSVVYGSGSFDDPADPKTKVRGLQRGRNVLQWKITYNSGALTDTVEIWNMAVTDAQAGFDRTVCSYDYELQGNSPKEVPYTVTDASLGNKQYKVKSTQLWELISGGCTFQKITDKYNSTMPDTIQNAYVTDLKQGVNTFVYKIYNGICESTDTVKITNDMADRAFACGLDNTCDTITTCDGTARLSPNSPSYGTGEWRVASGGSGRFLGNDVYDLGQGYNSLIWAISTETGGACNSTDTVVVLNLEPTVADAGSDDVLNVCGSSAILSANKPMYFTEAYWELIEGGGQFEETHKPGDGIYTVKNGVTVKVGTWTVDSLLAAGFTRKVTSHIDGTTDTTDVYYRLSSRVPIYKNDGTDNQTLNVQNLAFGNNRFRWVIVNEGLRKRCTSTDETVLNNIFIQAVAGNVSPQCSDSVRLTANNPYPGVGQWSVKAGNGRGVFEDSYDPHTMVRGLASGANTLLWTVNYLECPSVDSVVVVNNKATDAHIEGSIQQLCDTNATIVTASELAVDETGAWTETGYWEIAGGGGDIKSPYSPSTKITDIPFNADGNRYRWVITRKYGAFTCISMSEILVEYNKIEAIAGDDQRICDNKTKLEAISAYPGTGTWSVLGASSAGTFTDINEATTTISNLGYGDNVLQWKTSYKGCTSTDEVIITNGMPSLPYAGSLQETCEDQVTLDARRPEIGHGVWSTIAGSGSWSDDENAVNSSYKPNPTIEISKGDNTFRWTVSNSTEYLQGFDADGNPSFDVLTCELHDDVTIRNMNPSDAIAGADYPICSDEYTLKAVEPTYGTGLWSIDIGSGSIENPKTAETKVTGLGYGPNIFIWTTSVEGRCAKESRVTISNFSPTKADAGPDIDDCSPCQVLDANVPAIGSGLWTVISGSVTDEYGNPSFDNAADPKTKVCNLVFGENKFLWVITNLATYQGDTYRCQSVDTVSIWNLIPDQANANDDQVRCHNYTQLNANIPSVGRGTWKCLQGFGEIADPHDAKTTVTNLNYGENIFRWTIEYGECRTEDDMVVLSQEADPYAGENDVTYEDSYNLNAGNPGRLSGYWTSLGTSQYIEFEDSTSYHTKVTGLSPGINTFRWTIETEDCKVYDEVSITYKVVPNAGFSVDQDHGCYPLTVRFTDETTDGKQYFWNFGDGEESTLRNPTHTYNTPGSYRVTLTVPGPDGKESSYSMYITVYDHPTASFDAAPKLVYIPDDNVHFVNRSLNGEHFYWEFGDGGTSEDKNPTYQYQQEGLYTVTLTVTSENGCAADTTKENFIEARQGGFIVFPNTFAPRDDVSTSNSIFGVNSTFRPVYKDVVSFHMQIFNRWGQLIFETDDINVGWDGRFNGSVAPEGMYVYTAKGRFVSGKEYSKAGQVLIIK